MLKKELGATPFDLFKGTCNLYFIGIQSEDCSSHILVSCQWVKFSVDHQVHFALPLILLLKLGIYGAYSLILVKSRDLNLFPVLRFPFFIFYFALFLLILFLKLVIYGACLSFAFRLPLFKFSLSEVELTPFL